MGRSYKLVHVHRLEVAKLQEANKEFGSSYHHAQTAKDEVEGEKNFLQGRADALQIELEKSQNEV